MPKNLEARQILNDRDEQLRKLRALFSTPFNESNPEHLKALKTYLDNFEFDLARKELYKTGNRIMFGYLVYFAVTWFFRIQAFDSIATPTLAFGVMCELLNRASKTDYANTITEMKELYNWVMKSGKDEYIEGMDATDKMTNSDVQRLILLLAPHTTPEFMQAWPKILVNQEPTQQSTMSWLYNSASSAISYGYSRLTSQPKSDEVLNEEHKVRALKLLVEKDEVSSGVVKSMADVCKKITSDPEFRSMVLTKGFDFVKEPVTQFVSGVKDNASHIVPHPKMM